MSAQLRWTLRSHVMFMYLIGAAGVRNYKQFDEQMSWNDARIECIKKGMVLAEVTDADMRSRGGVLHIWVGANDQKNRGTFVWDHSRSPIDDRDLWDQGQPRPDRWAFQSCAGINNNHKLEVYVCTIPGYFLCMYNECGSNEEFELGEICYRLYPTPRRWRDGKAECENNGLHFAKLTRDEDLVDLQSLINQQQVWVGAIEEENHRYHWVFDGQPLAMQVTDESQGDGCVMLLNMNSLQSKVCDTRLPYLCMKKPTASTITITTPAPKVWFGQGDLFLCHCEAPHCGAGACQGDTAPCEQNWFGLRCQYRNLAGAAYVIESSLPSLTDNDDSTCHQQDTERSVTVKFREEQVITWIRIVVKDKIDHYTVQAFSGFTPRACTNMSVLQPTPTTLDLACNLGTVYVTKVTVSWRVHHVICSLYISGGRNLALKSRVSHSPAANTTPSGAAVDGQLTQPSDAAVDGQLTQPCLVLNDSVTHQQLQLVFSTPKLITEIVIHTSTANTSYGTLDGFRLEVVGEGEVSLQNLTGVRADVTGRLRFKSIVRRPAMRVDVNLVTQPGHPMEVCELEVFGDCSSPVYGLYCDEICSMGCVDQLCHYNGQCYHCVEGRTGKHCVGGNSNASFVPEEFDDSRNVTSPPTHEPKEFWISFGFDLVVLLLYLGAVVCFLLCFIVFWCCRRKAQEIEKVHRLSVVSDNSKHQIPRFVSQIGPVESTNSLISRRSLEESIIVDDFQQSVVSAASSRKSGTSGDSGTSRLSRDTEV